MIYHAEQVRVEGKTSPGTVKQNGEVFIKKEPAPCNS
jgi:hypothetical protein